MNIKQLIVHYFTDNKDRAFREVETDAVNTMVAVRLEGEFLNVMVSTLVDILDSTGTVSKTTVEEMMEKRLKEVKASKELLEVMKKVASGLPSEERRGLYNEIIDSVVNEKPNGKRPL